MARKEHVEFLTPEEREARFDRMMKIWAVVIFFAVVGGIMALVLLPERVREEEKKVIEEAQRHGYFDPKDLKK